MLLTIFSFYHINFTNIFIVLYYSSCNHFPYMIKIKEKFTGGRKGERAEQLISRTKRSHSKDQAPCLLCNHQIQTPAELTLSGELNSANLVQLYQKSAYNRSQSLSLVQFSPPVALFCQFGRVGGVH